jgi:TfoX/Sxy family transcriptional regulator of competence genes
MDRDFLIDLFADFGPVTIRRMFSGFGISADGTNFALALRAGLYLRADEQTIPQFEAEGSQPFQYQTRTKTVTVSTGNCRRGCLTILRNWPPGRGRRWLRRSARHCASGRRRARRRSRRF